MFLIRYYNNPNFNTEFARLCTINSRTIELWLTIGQITPTVVISVHSICIQRLVLK